jgi:hypothetical protein
LVSFFPIGCGLIPYVAFAERFNINLPLGRILGQDAKQIEFAKEESEIIMFCKNMDFQSIQNSG